MVIMILTTVSVAMSVFVLHIHSLGDRSYRVPPWVHNLVARYLARLVGLSHVVKHRQGDLTTEASSYYADETSKPLRVDCEDLNGRYRLIQVQGSGLYILARDDDSTVFEKDEKQEINDLHKIREQGRVLQAMKAVIVRQVSEETAEENHHSNHQQNISGGADVGSRLRFGHQKPALLWRDISEILDRFFFWISFIANTVSTMCILVVLPLSKPDPLANYHDT